MQNTEIDQTIRMSKYTKLVKNSGIFAIANIGSHVISFVLVRFYTELLSKPQYGTVDVMVTTTSLIIPIISLAIVESVLRFSMDADNPQEVFSNGLFVAICGSLAFAVIGPWIFVFTSYFRYFAFMLFLVFVTSIDNICAQYVRGIGKVTIFALAGIIKTTVLAGSNILFLLGFGWKVEGYMLSMIMAALASTLFLFICSKAYKGLRIYPNKPLLKQMTKYSIPLIPNSLSWWIMNAADKYAILLLLGASFNGLYAVAHKLPSLINVCNTLFFQAWQLSAVEESNSEKKAEFYSTVFNVLAFLLFILAGFLLTLLKPITSLIASSEYQDAWRYTPFLIVGMVFAAFSSFLGTNYVAMKKTKGALKTTLVGALVNVVLNFVFIFFIGMNGAALATMISFAVTWIYRAIDTRAFVRINYKMIPLTFSIILILLQSILMIFGFAFSIYSGCIICVLILMMYRKEVGGFMKIVKQYTQKKKRKVT